MQDSFPDRQCCARNLSSGVNSPYAVVSARSYVKLRRSLAWSGHLVVVFCDDWSSVPLSDQSLAVFHCFGEDLSSDAGLSSAWCIQGLLPLVSYAAAGQLLGGLLLRSECHQLVSCVVSCALGFFCRRSSPEEPSTMTGGTSYISSAVATPSNLPLTMLSRPKVGDV